MKPNATKIVYAREIALGYLRDLCASLASVLATWTLTCHASQTNEIGCESHGGSGGEAD